MNPRTTPPQGRYTVRRAGSEVVIPRTHGDHRSGAGEARPWGGILSKSRRLRPGLESKGR